MIKLLITDRISSVLDFGCGTGHSLKYLQRYFGENIKLSGCDVSEKSLEIASKVSPSGNFFLNSSPELFNNADLKFDLIVIACVYRHVPPEERRGWTEVVINALSDNEYLAVFEHNLFNPFVKHIVNKKDNVDREDYMLSHKELIQLVTANHPNVKIFWHGYVLFSPWRTKFITQTERFLKWLPIGAQHCIVIKKYNEI